MVRVIGPSMVVREMPADPAPPAAWVYGSGTATLARALAGDGLLGGVRGPALDLETERPERVETVDLPRLEQRLALVGDVVGDDRVQEDRVRARGRRCRLDGLTVEELERQADAGAADGGGLVTAAPLSPA